MKPAVKFSPLLRTSDCCDAFFLSSLQFSAFHLPPSAPFPRNPLLPSLHSAHQLFQNPSSQTIPKANSSQSNLVLAADTPDPPSAYKVNLIETEFHRLMWDDGDV